MPELVHETTYREAYTWVKTIHWDPGCVIFWAIWGMGLFQVCEELHSARSFCTPCSIKFSVRVKPLWYGHFVSEELSWISRWSKWVKLPMKFNIPYDWGNQHP